MNKHNRKINTIDLFAGCGGLMEGFEKNGNFETLACVEWDKASSENLIRRLSEKWGYSDAKERVVRFDIQRTEELFGGWDDPEYGANNGLDYRVGNSTVELIIGGPPCQAYSVAGRIRDENGMKNDYRNYLFERYLKVVNKYRPKFFIFENVPGLLSAAPDGELIINKIKIEFTKLGYIITDDFKRATIDLSEYGVPQNRKRVIILGVNSHYYGEKSNEILDKFYNEMLRKYRTSKVSVKEAIGNLPELYPASRPYQLNGKKLSHELTNCDIANHIPRFHNERDINIFNMLAQDIESGEEKYINSEELKKIYLKMTGKKSNVHKYYVLRWDRQSNTIPAHLYKDGLRHIHPDPKQSRSLTVREAARLQTFDDDYEFIGSNMDQYKMIGNAVPPLFSKVIADIMKEIFETFN